VLEPHRPHLTGGDDQRFRLLTLPIAGLNGEKTTGCEKYLATSFPPDAGESARPIPNKALQQGVNLISRRFRWTIWVTEISAVRLIVENETRCEEHLATIWSCGVRD